MTDRHNKVVSNVRFGKDEIAKIIWTHSRHSFGEVQEIIDEIYAQGFEIVGTTQNKEKESK